MPMYDLSRACFLKRMDNVGVSTKSSNIKWCTPLMRAYIHARPTPEKFLDDIQASRISGIVKWCPTCVGLRIHGDALIQKRLDAIQVSSPSRTVNGCHLLLCTNRIIPFHQGFVSDENSIHIEEE